jgi:hypothetical protein
MHAGTSKGVKGNAPKVPGSTDFLFKAYVVIDGIDHDRYNVACPSGGMENEVSGDGKNEAKRDGRLEMARRAKVESVTGQAFMRGCQNPTL